MANKSSKRDDICWLTRTSYLEAIARPCREIKSDHKFQAALKTIQEEWSESGNPRIPYGRLESCFDCTDGELDDEAIIKVISLYRVARANGSLSRKTPRSFWEASRFSDTLEIELDKYLAVVSPAAAAVATGQIASRNHSEEIRNEAPRASQLFPNRARWLKERLSERGWTKHDANREGGLHHKTIQKILDGFPVYEDSLNKLALVLSKKHKVVALEDIPAD